MTSHCFWIFCLLFLPCVSMAFVQPAIGGDPTTAGTTIAEANNRFAADLYAQLDADKTGENLFFSPTSLSLALAMAAGGAKGETEAEMAKVLHLTDILPQAHAEYRKLLERWNSQDKDRGYQLRVANRLWGEKGFSFLESYLALTKQEYGAELGVVDFSKQTEAARKEINAWVEKQTVGKIRDLLPPGMIDASTRLVLTNAIYFKGDWAKPFKKEATHDEDFTVDASKKVKVPLMHQKLHVAYLEDDSLQAVVLPYKGKADGLSMLVILPKKVDGLPALEKSLSAAKIGEMRSKLGGSEVELFLPKFKLEASFMLADTLKALGMRAAFTPEADFSGMDGKRDLFLSAVVHKAFVDVNETGTEAAAATGMAMAMAAAPSKTPPPVFRADHPFLFMICDQQDGNILFMGRLTNPQ